MFLFVFVQIGVGDQLKPAKEETAVDLTASRILEEVVVLDKS